MKVFTLGCRMEYQKDCKSLWGFQILETLFFFCSNSHRYKNRENQRITQGATEYEVREKMAVFNYKQHICMQLNSCLSRASMSFVSAK